MRARVILIASLGLNAILLVGLLLLWREFELPKEQERASVASAGATNLAPRTNLILRRQNLTWADIESPDYPTYIRNLRALGCPEDTIRDIIVADVNALFAHRRAAEVVTPAQQWWRSAPDPEVLRAAAEKSAGLERERRELLTRLLGSGWEIAATPNPEADAESLLSGPILGQLSPGVQAAVQDILTEAARRLEGGEAGRELSAAEVARIRQETREALGRVLTAPQLEEYLLRYSQNANSLRQQIGGLTVSPDEFRRLFRQLDAIDQDIQLHYTGNDPAAAQRRRELEVQRDSALEQELGAERARMYRLNQQPGFREVRELAEQVGAAPETVLPMFQLNQAVTTERTRVQGDATLSEEERQQRLLEIQADWQASLRRLLGDDAFRRYRGETNAPPGG